MRVLLCMMLVITLSTRRFASAFVPGFSASFLRAQQQQQQRTWLHSSSSDSSNSDETAAAATADTSDDLLAAYRNTITLTIKSYPPFLEMAADMLLSEAVGKGNLQCVKNHPNWTNPYNGITEIRHGDVDRDVGLYLAESEQKACALAAATTMNGILCTSAGGYLVEQLPGVDPETVAQVETNLAKGAEMHGRHLLPTNLLLQGVSPVEIICQMILEDLDMQPIQQMQPKLLCDCSDERTTCAGLAIVAPGRCR